MVARFMIEFADTSLSIPGLVEPPVQTTIREYLIAGILSVCAKMEYKKLVLGAWGCGSFGNDPILVARLFEKNICQFEGFFDEVEFVVLGDGANFDCFYKVFVLREFE